MPKDVLGHTAYSISEVLAMPNTRQKYLLEDLIYVRGKTVVVGKPKVGKSWLGLKVGHSIATGQPLLGLQVTPASVLLLEFDRRFLTGAVHEIAQGQNTDRMNILAAPATPLNEEEGYRLLLAAVHECYPKSNGELLVIIDHKSACFSGKEGEDAPNREWLRTLDRVESLFPLSYLVICQAPKGWRGDIVDLPFGSRLLTAWADTVISAHRISKDTRRLEMVSNYGEIDPITYTKDFEVIGEVVEETKLEVAMTIIEEQWDKFKYPRTTRKVEETAEKLGCSYTTAWTAFREVKKLMKAREQEEMNATEEDGSEDSNDTQT